MKPQNAPTLTNRGTWLSGAIVLALLLLPVFLPGYLVATGIVLVVYTGLAVSWNLTSGYSNYPSFGHHGFFGIGAYAGALLTPLVVGESWALWAPLVGGLAAAAVAVPLGAVLLKTRGVYFAIATLAFGEIVRTVILNWREVTGGIQGIITGTAIDLNREYYLVLSIVVLMVLVTWSLERSRYGMRIRALGNDDEAARALGIRVDFWRVSLFVVGAFFAGALGGAYVDHVLHLTPEAVASARLTLIAVLLAIAGGIGSIAGTLVGSIVVGGVLVTLGVEMIRIQEILIGSILIVIALSAPGGLTAIVARRGVVWHGVRPALVERHFGIRPWSRAPQLGMSPQEDDGDTDDVVPASDDRSRTED